jgi:hypothetical protein
VSRAVAASCMSDMSRRRMMIRPTAGARATAGRSSNAPSWKRRARWVDASKPMHDDEQTVNLHHRRLPVEPSG